MQSSFIFGGIMNVKLADSSFDLGGGIQLKQTFAHLMSVNMMAFAPPQEERHHPAGPTHIKFPVI